MRYNAIVLPYFDHCRPLWDNCGNTLKNRQQKFQNRAARLITGKSYDVPSVDLLANLQWASFETRCINSKLLFVYKIINGHTALNLQNKFRFNYETECPYNLRNISTDLALQDFCKTCFNNSAAVLRNNIPYEAKTAPTVWSFKKLIHQE